MFSVSLILLGVLSRSFRSGFSDESNEYQPPKIIPSKGNGYPPVIAYWIFGTKGESKKMLRLLKAIYHPRNQYLLQLDAESSGHERGELALSIQSEKVFQAFGNVHVVGKSYAVNQMGASALGATLHAAALLLKISTDWDWFITLSASDYPLMTQDGKYYTPTFFFVFYGLCTFFYFILPLF